MNAQAQVQERIEAVKKSSSANREVICRRWPDLAKRLYADPPPDDMRVSETPQPTLVIGGLHLTGGYNQVKEAALQSMMIPPETKECVVYGLGLGHLPALLCQRPDLQKIIVVLMHCGLDAHVFNYSDQTVWLNDPRIELQLARDLKETLPYPTTASPMSCKLAEEKAWDFRDRLMVMFNRKYNEILQEERKEEIDARHKENKPFTERDPKTLELHWKRTGAKIVAVAAGPTVSANIDFIKTFGNENTFCVSTALRTLIANGIIPDIVFIVDSSRELLRHFLGFNLRLLEKSVLAYDPLTHTDILNIWPGPRHVFNSVHESALYCDGTVTHPMIDLAVNSGASEVTLVGGDFCYPDDKSHADGAAMPYSVNDVNNRWRPFVPNGYGVMVRSDDALNQYAHSLERYIEKVKTNVKFYKRDKSGVPIKGMEWI